MEPPLAEQIVASAQGQVEGAARWLAKEHGNQQESRTCQGRDSIVAGAVARPGSCSSWGGGGGYRVHKRVLQSENQDHIYRNRFLYPSIPASASSKLMNSIEKIWSSIIRLSATNIVPCNGGLWTLYRDILARCQRTLPWWKSPCA